MQCWIVDDRIWHTCIQNFSGFGLWSNFWYTLQWNLTLALVISLLWLALTEIYSILGFHGIMHLLFKLRKFLMHFESPFIFFI